MSKYDEIMDRVSLSEESRERIRQKTRKAAAKYGERRPDSMGRKITKYLAIAACFVLLLSGAAVLFQNSRTGPGMKSAESMAGEENMEAAREGDMEAAREEEMEAAQEKGQEKAYAGEDEIVEREDIAGASEADLDKAGKTDTELSEANQTDKDQAAAGQRKADQAGTGQVNQDSWYPMVRILCGVLIVLALCISGYLHLRRIMASSHEKDTDDEIMRK